MIGPPSPDAYLLARPWQWALECPPAPTAVSLSASRYRLAPDCHHRRCRSAHTPESSIPMLDIGLWTHPCRNRDGFAILGLTRRRYSGYKVSSRSLFSLIHLPPLLSSLHCTVRYLQLTLYIFTFTHYPLPSSPCSVPRICNNSPTSPSW